MKTIKISLLVLLSITGLLSAQKVPLDNTVYDGWKNLSSKIISEDGKWVSYTINPQQGDGWLYIYNVASGQKDSVPRGSRALFSPDSKYLAYYIVPAYNTTREAKKKKFKEDKMPKNGLEVRLLSDNEVTKIARVKSFVLPEKKSYWMKNGISQLEKGKIDGYDLINE